MAEKTIVELVQQIIVEQLGVPPERVTPEANLINDLCADSLDYVELALAFEEEFDIEVPDDEMEKIRTVADAVKYIEEKKKP
jgi:acyl carrier protein